MRSAGAIFAGTGGLIDGAALRIAFDVVDKVTDGRWSDTTGLGDFYQGSRTMKRLGLICLLAVFGIWLTLSMARGAPWEHNGADCTADFNNCNIDDFCVTGRSKNHPDCQHLPAGKRHMCRIYGSSPDNKPISFKICVHTGNSSQECTNEALPKEEWITCNTLDFMNCQCMVLSPDRCYYTYCECDPANADGQVNVTLKGACTDGPAA